MRESIRVDSSPSNIIIMNGENTKSNLSSPFLFYCEKTEKTVSLAALAS